MGEGKERRKGEGEGKKAALIVPKEGRKKGGKIENILNTDPSSPFGSIGIRNS